MNHPLVAVRHGARRAPVIRNSELGMLPTHPGKGVCRWHTSRQATRKRVSEKPVDFTGAVLATTPGQRG